MDVVKTITKSINGYIFNLSEKISDEHGIPIEDILKVWCDQQNISFTNVFLPMLKISKKQKKLDTTPEDDTIGIIPDVSSVNNDTLEPVEDTASKAIASTSDGTLCEYLFSRGPKKGARCTIIAKTGTLCSKHKTK